MGDYSTKRVFLDISVDNEYKGRIIIELFDKIVPKTCENFRALCTGEYGIKQGVNMTYRGSPFHRVVKNSLIQGGDITAGDGSGGMSIYGKLFDDEECMGHHSEPYLVSMANCGPNTNSSQFFITTSIVPQYDFEFVVFGRVIEGIELIRKIEKFNVDNYFKPTRDVRIKDCGELFREVKVVWIERKPEKRGNLMLKRSGLNSNGNGKLCEKSNNVDTGDGLESISSDSEIEISSISSEETCCQDNLSDIPGDSIFDENVKEKKEEVEAMIN